MENDTNQYYAELDEADGYCHVYHLKYGRLHPSGRYINGDYSQPEAEAKANEYNSKGVS